MNRGSRWTAAALTVALTSGLARAQTTERVSVDSGGTEGNDYSYDPSISADGRFVAFVSHATNLVTGDMNPADVFVRDRQNGTTERVSVDSGGVQGNGVTWNPSISADGRFVAFYSIASNLVAADTNGFYDVFVHDRQTGTTERVSVATGGAESTSDGAQPGDSTNPSISADGRFVVFHTRAVNLVASDTNGGYDVLVRDLQSGTTEHVSVAPDGTAGNGLSAYPEISADGRFVAFWSAASNLIVGDTNGLADVFVRDLQSGTTERVGVQSVFPSISADGRFVAFSSDVSTFVVGDTNGHSDIFVHDRQSGGTERVSVATGGAEADDVSRFPSISADGRFVVFWSLATSLVSGDTNGAADLFVRDRQSGTTERVSVDSGGAEGNAESDTSSISADGRFVAFGSLASNLVAGDTNGTFDVFVRDHGSPTSPSPFCFGDGSAGACPCGNSGSPGGGCQNSASTGGAVLTASGSSSISGDTLVLTSSGELANVLSIFLQGDATIVGVNFGDGLRCVHGHLKRLYVGNASGGVVSAPQAGDPSISARSAALGDPIPTGTLRHYQTHYRDTNLAFCPNPPGNSWNISNGLSVVWLP